MSLISQQISTAVDYPDSIPSLERENYARIKGKMNDLLEGVWSYRNSKGELITQKTEKFRLDYPKAFEDPSGTVVLWPNREAVLLTDDVVGRGLTTTVYVALDLMTGKRCVGGFSDPRGIEIQLSLKGKRGIAQIYNTMSAEFRGKYKHFYYGELYDADLAKRLGWCDLEDFKVITKDLVYGVLALEGEDPDGEWIYYDDIKDRNIFLRIEKTTRRILGAYLGDFANARKTPTVKTDEATLKMEEEKFGGPLYPTRETQRERFVTRLFHQIADQLIRMHEDISLQELCADDPICKNFMAEIEKKYDYILERPYHHWED